MSTGMVTVYSPSGVPLADLDTNVLCSWVLNGPGEATFSLSTKNNKCQDQFLRYGNKLLVQHDDLPDWVGIMDTPRTWNYGKVECRAVGGEAWFDWRVTNYYFMVDNLAEIYRYLIDDCNSWGGSQMGFGEITTGGIWAAAAFGGKASDIINRLCKKFQADWSVTSRVNPTSNRLYLRANMYAGMRGSWTNLVLNNVNSKLTEPIQAEDGAIFNHVFFYSAPGDAGGRKVGEAKDKRSIMHYDLRQYAEQGVGSDETGLAFAAWRKLQDSKEPKVMIAPSVLNVENAWKSLQVGNIIYWDSDFAGFGRGLLGMSATLRIVGMEYSDADQTVTLVTEMLKPYWTRSELINLALDYGGEMGDVT